MAIPTKLLMIRVANVIRFGLRKHFIEFVPAFELENVSITGEEFDNVAMASVAVAITMARPIGTAMFSNANFKFNKKLAHGNFIFKV